MALSVWEMFVALFRQTESNDEESEREEDRSGFVPSPLDLSVRIGHGGTDDEQLRALSKIDEQAKQLKEQQRED
jgi:hypothetical protein